MADKTIAQLTAKTPLTTDLIPVADPVTGVAGKSTVLQMACGQFSNSPITFTPAVGLDITKDFIFGPSSYYNNSNRIGSIPIAYAGVNLPLDESSYSLNINCSYSVAFSETTSIVINAEYLSPSNNSYFANLPNVTSFSAPNLKIGVLSIQYLVGITSFSIPELYYGSITLQSLILLTGTLTIPKLKNGSIQIYATGLTALNLPELISGGITVQPSGYAPNFTTISAPKFKYCSTFSVLGLTAFTSIDLPELETEQGVGFDITPSAIVSINAPKLKAVNCVFRNTGTHTLLSTLNLPLLKHCNQGIFRSGSGVGFSVLTSLNFPELVSHGTPTKTWSGSGTTMTYGFGASTSLAITTSSPNLTTINFPKLEYFTASGGVSINITSAPALSTFNINPTPKFINGSFTVTGAALNQASVDGILVALAYMDGTVNAPYPAYSSKTINLSGGTSATPSATGLAAKATLVARGCTVTHN